MKKSVVYARIDTYIKEEAEAVLKALGLTPTSVIQLFYKQVALQQRIPFPITLPGAPVCVDALAPEELDRELQKGMDSPLGKTAAEVQEQWKKKFDI